MYVVELAYDTIAVANTVITKPVTLWCLRQSDTAKMKPLIQDYHMQPSLQILTSYRNKTVLSCNFRFLVSNFGRMKLM